MSSDTKSKTFSVIAGVSLILLVIAQYVIIPIIITGVFFARGMILNNLFIIVCCMTMGVIHLLGKADKIRLRILSVLMLIIAVHYIWGLIQWLPWNMGYDISMSRNESGTLTLLFIMEILQFISYVILGVIYWLSSSNITEKKIKLLSWIIYVPPILYFVPSLLSVGFWNYFFSSMFFYILYPTAFLFSGLWIKRLILNKERGIAENDG